MFACMSNQLRGTNHHLCTHFRTTHIFTVFKLFLFCLISSIFRLYIFIRLSTYLIKVCNEKCTCLFHLGWLVNCRYGEPHAKHDLMQNNYSKCHYKLVSNRHANTRQLKKDQFKSLSYNSHRFGVCYDFSSSHSQFSIANTVHVCN